MLISFYYWLHVNATMLDSTENCVQVNSHWGASMLSIQKIKNYPVWHVESEDKWELAMTFLRMTEYYESMNPDFQGHVFSMEEYTNWYVRVYSKDKKPYGAFTYASDWSAFNVPARAVRAVYEKFAQHSSKETWLFAELKKDGAFAEADFYLIGNQRGSPKAYFDHEFRHALFAVNSEYRYDVIAIVSRYPLVELSQWILKHYAPSVLVDEIQAYALTGWPSKVRATDEMRALRRELKAVEKKYLTRT